MTTITGIDDVEWLDAKVGELSKENADLKSNLRAVLSLMELDIERDRFNGQVSPTRERVLAEARCLVGTTSKDVLK